MRYIIEKADGLYCVYKWDKVGYRIIAAYETLAEANHKINDLRNR